MKLTKYDREAFVRAVMDDVPQVDYDGQARKIVEEWANARIPATIKKALKDHPEWFERIYIYSPGVLNPFYIYCDKKGYVIRDESPETWKKLETLNQAKHEQKQSRNALKSKVEAVINGCTTLKQAKERLPEFVKYLPAERDATGTVNLPAIANVVADLTKAGWPKSQSLKVSSK